jgi:hypothetical protein
MQFILGVEGRSLPWFVRYACMHILIHPRNSYSQTLGRTHICIFMLDRKISIHRLFFE